MSVSRITSRNRRLNKAQKLSVAGVSTLAAAALAFSLVPDDAAATTEPQAAAGAPVVFAGTAQTKDIRASVIEQHSTAEQLVKAADAAKAKAADKAEKKAEAVAEAKSKAAAEKKAEAAADAKKRSAEKASRAATRKPVFADNLDGWIREALSIMHEKKIPGTYEGLHRNIMRESSGNPRAINNWDINAINGIPSKGLLQVIKPTFDFYHVNGTKHDQYDPVANITAAANYAADKYGSIDNVDSAY
ncbi:transglycosylase SLT domain-containing protein [Streptomyces sp. NPDC005899]|uniref:transglycosylase SLT domain-containing protein n=1 Tax=Streptomyces sp. NPDC005899 TaxID=3155716 RepID=UPI0033E72BC7